MKSTSKLVSILLAVCEVIIGVLLLIDPVSFTNAILRVLGGILIIMGVVSAVQYFRASPVRAAAGKGLARGCVEIALGVFCIVKSGWFLTMFPVLTILYGIVTLVSGFAKLQWTVDMLRLKMRKWGLAALSSVVTILCALVILANPFASAAVLWVFIGVALIIEAIADFIAAILMRPEENEIIG